MFLTPLALVVLPVSHGPIESRDDTLLLVRRYSFEAFPQWASVHHEELCPPSLDDLSWFIGRADAIDRWNTPLELRCGPGYRGAYVRSAGPDRTFETPDDISSHD